VVDNPFLRQSFRGAMDFLMAKRAAQFPTRSELESLRTLGEPSASTTWASCPTCSNSSKPT
jgi:L-lactate dehydrogenase complex protein LldF